jgi:uncharacterized membrane protein
LPSLDRILRSPSFLPVNPHFAGGFINYYYFGIYLVAYLIKLTGIYAEVFDLAIATLFCAYSRQSICCGLFCLGERESGALVLVQRPGCSVAGTALCDNLGQVRWVCQVGSQSGQVAARHQVQPALPALPELVGAWVSCNSCCSGRAALPDYDFWGAQPSHRVDDQRIPFWSFLFADLHPHLIGIPVSVLFLGLTLALIAGETAVERTNWKRGVGLSVLFALLLGALASVNLWELPTYFGLGVLALLVSQFRSRSHPLVVDFVDRVVLCGWRLSVLFSVSSST